MISACSKVEDSLNQRSMDRAERRQRRLDQKQQNWGVIGGKRKDASRGLDQESVDQRASKCADCGSEEKKLSRGGPLGPRTLCNACGLRWGAKKRATNAAKNLQDISSEEESVQDIVQERGPDMYIKDLERKLRDLKNEQQKLQKLLHVSDCRVTTYQKLSDQGQRKVDKLQTLVETLTAKIGEISSPPNGGPSAAETECARLRSEMRAVEEKHRTEVRMLEEKNRQLMENMQVLSELLNKNFSAGKEILAQSIEINGEHNSRSWRNGAVTDQQPQTGHYQESKKASNAVKTKYDEGPPIELDGDIDVDVDADIGDNEPDYNLRKSGRLGTVRNHHEDPGHISNGVRGSGKDTAGKSRDHEWERGYHGEPSDLANGVVRDRRSDEVRGLGKDVEGRPDMPVAGVNGQRVHGGSSGDEIGSRLLISHEASLLARDYVDQRFITWVNGKLRKPTPEEMVFHKTQFRNNGKTCYWSGIPGSEILGQYVDACRPKRIPDSEELEMVLRTILHIEACPMRPSDVLWCLVWQDCEEIEQLPGYHDMDIARDVARATGRMGDMRRPRSPVAAGVVDSDRPLRQRYEVLRRRDACS